MAQSLNQESPEKKEKEKTSLSGIKYWLEESTPLKRKTKKVYLFSDKCKFKMHLIAKVRENKAIN